MIISINEETHRPRRHPRTDITQQHLHYPLNKEHHIPLLQIITTQRKIFRLINETTPHPAGRIRSLRQTRRMHVKPLGSLRKHSCTGPLRGPKTDPLQHSFIASNKLTKDTSVSLRENCSWKNFYSWNPGMVNFGVF